MYGVQIPMAIQFPKLAVYHYHLLNVADPHQVLEIPICPPPDQVF